MFSPKIKQANVALVKPINKNLQVRLQDEVKEAVAESKWLRDALVEATTTASAQALTLEQMKGIHTEESKNFLLEKKVLVKRLAEKMEDHMEEHLEKKMEDHTKVPGPVPLSIDVGGVEFAGRKDNFIVTNINNHNFDILDVSSMKQFIKGRPVGKYMTEHVFEHLSYNDAKKGFQNMYATLIDGGRVRICVPDGYLPSVTYQEYIKVGNAFDHKMVWTIDNLKPLLEKVGFEVVPLEYWNKNGTERYTGKWDDKDGYLQRTSKERTDTYDNILHTSLSLDAFKTTTKCKDEPKTCAEWLVVVLPSGCYGKCVVKVWSTAKFDEDAKQFKCTKEEIKQFTDEYECTANACSLKKKALTPSPAAKAPGPAAALGLDSENTAGSLGLGRFAVVAAAASVAASVAAGGVSEVDHIRVVPPPRSCERGPLVANVSAI